VNAPVNTVVVMVGTDHHPFHRLVDWVDEAARRHPGHRFVVQHGHSKAPAVAEGQPFLSSQRIRELLTDAVGAVVHGGPGTIMDARHAGHVPICVPRDPARGEHVDGHQQRFAALVDAAGVVTLADTEEGFHRAVEQVLLADAVVRLDVPLVNAVTTAARQQLAEELDLLLGVGLAVRVPRQRRPRPGIGTERPSGV
jgi:UDP-N-acetylglucosamine transferase subunit ALG13